MIIKISISKNVISNYPKVKKLENEYYCLFIIIINSNLQQCKRRLGLLITNKNNSYE